MASAVETALIAVAGLFALFCGLNDGGTLLVTSLKLTSLRPLTVALLLTAMVIVAPIVIGTQVATTLAGRLVSFQGSDGPVAVLIAVVGAMIVVGLLSIRGLPTSLTLALIGGILGAALGGGLPVGWGWVALVLTIAAVAPFVGMAGAFVVVRLWGWLRLPVPVENQVRHAHRASVAAQAFAYGTNDGQKMLAVLAVGWPAGVVDGRVELPLWTLPAVGLMFFLGTLLGVRRYAARLGAGVLPVTPVHAVTAQLSSAFVVTGTAIAGAPVSMTQAVAGALVGSGLTEGTGRIRWRQVAAIAGAWVLTLPAAGLTAAAAAAIAIRT